MTANTTTRLTIAAGLLVAGVGVILASCTAGPAGDPPSPQAASQPPATADPRLTERGRLPKQIGEPAGINAPDGTQPVLFTITRAEINPTCPPRPQGVYADQMRPENGHFTRLSIEVTTGPGYDTNYDPFYGLTWVDDQGYSHNQVRTFAASLCEADQGLSTAMGPGQRYRGVIVLDVPSTSGVLLLQTVAQQAQGFGGWEYPIA